MEERYYYKVGVQYLGFRYSGWQKQPGQKTVESMLSKTLKFILPNTPFKLLGAGRTDAKVSSLNGAFTLILKGSSIDNREIFIEQFNANLPADIRIMSLQESSPDFNIIKDVRIKEYTYLFSFGQKNHPFCAPFMANILEDLDIEGMIRAAKLFEGTHDFSNYTARLQENTRTLRTISSCAIRLNTLLSASFFPERSYGLHIRGSGFMRYQVRMMMGALIQLGKGALQETDIATSLVPGNTVQMSYVAPGSGLTLSNLQFVSDTP